MFWSLCQHVLQRSDDHIKVTADSGHVTLSGTVATWSEFALAEDIAWMAPGVISVTNKLAVLLP